MDDLISVIVTVYNNEKSLKDCIMSIIKQTYRNMEIIIVDDGSTDSSPRICSELLIANSRLTILQELHSGVATARNKGLEVAKGKYVTFVNGSDTISNTMLETLKTMVDNYNSNISMCSTKSVNNTAEQAITFEKEDALRQLLIGDLIDNSPCGKLFNKELLIQTPFVENSANTLYKIFENCTRISFKNIHLYNMENIEEYSFNSIINKDLRLMKSYPSLSLYCKCNIIKTIQNELYNSFTNNINLDDIDKIYLLFKQTLQDNEEKISSYFSYIRRAHMYLLANDLEEYKRVCPVLPELT